MKEKINTKTNNGYKPTELGPLPQEWQVVRLGDVAEKMKAGGTPRTNVNEYWNGKIPLVKVEDVVNSYKYLTSTNLYISDIGLKNSSAWIVPQGSIILTMYGTAGEVCINKIPVAVTQNVMGIISKNKTLITEFLYYALKFAKNYTLHLISDKTIFTHFTLSKAKNLLIPLPPLEEQKKIAAVLSTVQKAIEIESKLIERTKELKKSTMHKLFREGTKGEKQKMTEIGPIPESWEVVRLGDVAVIIRNGVTIEQEKDKIGFKITRIETISNFFIDELKVGYSNNVNQEILKKYLIKKGDILFSHINSDTHIGKTAIAKKDYKDLLHGMNLLLIRLNESLAIPEFINYLFNHLYFIGFFKSICKRAVNQSSINQANLKSILIPLPPLSEQQAIADILSTIDQKIEFHTNKKQKLEELFRTLLHELMTAKIRINDVNLDFIKMEEI